MVAESFWTKVDRSSDDECWPWHGTRTVWGYGIVSFTHRDERYGTTAETTTTAHRIAYELLVGPIPDGLTLDHLCRNTSCCNPAHLEPCTRAENTRRQRAQQKVMSSGC